MDTTPTLRQRIFEMLMESQYWPPERMLEFQRSQLAQLLRHARANVPFYKTRLDPVFKNNGEIDWDRWHEIPIVTRADLRQRRTKLLAVELPTGHGPTREFSTSGSSGVPIKVTVTSIATTARHAAMERFAALHEIDSAKCKATFDFHREFKSWEQVIRNRKGVPIGGIKKDAQGFTMKVSPEASDIEKLSVLRNGRAAYLSSLPNDIEIIARKNLRLQNRLGLETIICFGQGATVEQRALFRKSFGAKIIEIYSSKEAGFMAAQCAGDSHFHINSELIYVEVLDSEGRACAPGESGRVVVTPLYSTAQPLIRYEQGDTATLGKLSSCGIQLPVLERIDGRLDPIFRLPGRLATEMQINKDLVSRALKAEALQMAQVAELRFELRYVARCVATQGNKVKVTSHLRKVLHPRLGVSFRKLARIPPNAGGKTLRFIREIP